MSNLDKKKTEKEVDALVNNIGKVYSGWIKKGIIGPVNQESLSDPTPKDQIEDINSTFETPIENKKKLKKENI